MPGPRAGTSAVEFALLAPLLALLLTATTDLVLWGRSWFRVDRVATELANIATQRTSLSASDITALFTAAQAMAGGIDVTGSGGATIISAVAGDGSRNTMAWQRRTGAAGFASRFGTAGGTVTLPGAFVLPAGQMVLIVEAFSSANLWVLGGAFMGGAEAAPVRSYAILQPRLGSLASAPK